MVKNKKLGAVYTPELLADWVASEMLARLSHKSPIFVIDPACGDGALLRSVSRMAKLKAHLAGIDVDNSAIQNAARSLPKSTKLICADALQPLGGLDVNQAWKRLIPTSHISGVISNPPWGADLRQTPATLRRAGYELAQGQFDSYDLFVELCLKVVPDRAILAFIIPDSLFLPEHKPLRKLLLERTQLHLVARLGEGFFDDVYRGTAVVVCEKIKPKLSKSVQCFRLRKEIRDQVFDNKLTLAKAKKLEAHLVPQKNFVKDPESRFTIDVSSDDQSYFQKIDRYRSDWAQWLISGRGVELSKSGSVILCPKCSTARPEPRQSKDITCDECGNVFALKKAKRISIIGKSATVPRGWRRLIVGEDVDRYTCSSTRIIKANVPGINYKTPSTFEGTKLLVRKTGVGIKAAIDDSGALTNQVVFHYRQQPSKSPSFFLDYVLGVLCSRVMLAYHLKRTGDNEWRSHPYVTQKTIAELPVPVISEGQWQWNQAKAIADAVAKRRSGHSNGTVDDLHIDSLVAGMYGLNKQGCSWVLGVLNEAQSLRAITTMRANATELKPVRI